MKIKYFILGMAALSVFANCSKEEKEEEKDSGLLSVNMVMWNSYDGSSKSTPGVTSPGEAITLDIIDVRSSRMDLKVTTDEVKEGMTDNFNWVPIYESSDTMLNSERDFQFELPAGNYRGIGILQGIQFQWVCRYGDQVMDVQDSNGDGNGGLEGLVYNIFGEDGLYVPDEGNVLVKVNNNEKLGTFEIKPGKKTLVTVRMNLMTLDWFDNDGDGQWSEGDGIDNWTLPEGVTTMADFLVEYQ